VEEKSIIANSHVHDMSPLRQRSNPKRCQRAPGRTPKSSRKRMKVAKSDKKKGLTVGSGGGEERIKSFVRFRGDLFDIDSAAFNTGGLIALGCTNEEVYKQTAKDGVNSAMSGKNFATLAYGQSGTGKSYTMNAITKRALEDIFSFIAYNTDRTYSVSVTYTEIYNETVIDLLTSPDPLAQGLKLQEDSNRNVQIQNVKEVSIANIKEAEEVISTGQQNRQVAVTAANRYSSRSHTIVQITIRSNPKVGTANDSTALVSSINLVDLAGSESADSIGPNRLLQRDSANIKKSLSTFTQVIRLLSRPSGDRPQFVPYRSSKLTRILQPSLCGDSLVSIVSCVDPSPAHTNETKRTLEFARCASQVRTSARVNVVPTVVAGGVAGCDDVSVNSRMDVRRGAAYNVNADVLEEQVGRLQGEVVVKDDEIKRLKASLSSCLLLEATLEPSTAETGRQRTEMLRHSDSHLFLDTNPSTSANGSGADANDNNADVLRQALVEKASIIGELQIKQERDHKEIESLRRELDTSHLRNVELSKRVVELEIQRKEDTTRCKELEGQIEVLQNVNFSLQSSMDQQVDALVKEKGALADENLVLSNEKVAFHSELDEASTDIKSEMYDSDGNKTVEKPMPVSDDSDYDTEDSDGNDESEREDSDENDGDGAINETNLDGDDFPPPSPLPVAAVELNDTDAGTTEDKANSDSNGNDDFYQADEDCDISISSGSNAEADTDDADGDGAAVDGTDADASAGHDSESDRGLNEASSGGSGDKLMPVSDESEVGTEDGDVDEGELSASDEDAADESSDGGYYQPDDDSNISFDDDINISFDDDSDVFLSGDGSGSDTDTGSCADESPNELPGGVYASTVNDSESGSILHDASSGSSGEAHQFVGIENPKGGQRIAKWNRRCGELFEYKEEHGHCCVPRKWEENVPLGKWVHEQRYLYQKSSMTGDRKAKLDKIGFVWDASHLSGGQVNNELWNTRFEQLREFKEKEGHCLMPSRHGPTKQLAIWVDTQRHQYRLRQKGKKSPMTGERIDKLEDVGFVWDASHLSGGQVDDEAWDRRFDELAAYKEKYGDCLVPKRRERNKQLKLWVDTQRKEYRLFKEGKKSRMTKKRIEKLDGIGFKWKVDLSGAHVDDEAWDHRFNELAAYEEKHGDCLVPQRYKPNKQLATWVKTQRKQYRLLQEGKTSSMTDERIAQLEDIGFKWKVRD